MELNNQKCWKTANGNENSNAANGLGAGYASNNTAYLVTGGGNEEEAGHSTANEEPFSLIKACMCDWVELCGLECPAGSNIIAMQIILRFQYKVYKQDPNADGRIGRMVGDAKRSKN